VIGIGACKNASPAYLTYPIYLYQFSHVNSKIATTRITVPVNSQMNSNMLSVIFHSQGRKIIPCARYFPSTVPILDGLDIYFH